MRLPCLPPVQRQGSPGSQRSGTSCSLLVWLLGWCGGSHRDRPLARPHPLLPCERLRTALAVAERPDVGLGEAEPGTQTQLAAVLAAVASSDEDPPGHQGASSHHSSIAFWTHSWICLAASSADVPP